MDSRRSKLHTLLVILLTSALCYVASAQQPEPQQPPDNIAGSWTIYANNINKAGSSLKTVQITQNGNILTGRFKGPHQSGKLQGWVNVHHVEFSTDTREVLTFRGQIQGNIMSGLYGIQGRHAQWRAERTDSPQ
ncbi:hypothetical protein [Granulicella sp. S190]|uniref:hypothetical protein n=1 Tax=Granulicella sp. S190 TaxID=1747226 RepID=UPI00131EB2E7|nr:hypothetical protein [Granulicella sp. S190]